MEYSILTFSMQALPRTMSSFCIILKSWLLKKLIWCLCFIVPFENQTLGRTADAARLHRASLYENWRWRNLPLCALQHEVSCTTLMLQPLLQTSALHGGVGKWQMSWFTYRPVGHVSSASRAPVLGCGTETSEYLLRSPHFGLSLYLANLSSRSSTTFKANW